MDAGPRLGSRGRGRGLGLLRASLWTSGSGPLPDVQGTGNTGQEGESGPVLSPLWVEENYGGTAFSISSCTERRHNTGYPVMMTSVFYYFQPQSECSPGQSKGQETWR